MPDEHLADALARLDRHKGLHLPLRASDLVGRLALRVLWKRHLKWQTEVNLATRDALEQLSRVTDKLASAVEHDANDRELERLAVEVAGLRTAVTELRRDGAAVDPALDDIRRDLAAVRAQIDDIKAQPDVLRHEIANHVTGLNQRLFSLVGGLRTELSDQRLQLTERETDVGELAGKVESMRSTMQQLKDADRDNRLRAAQLNVLTDRLQQSTKDDPTDSEIDWAPDRTDFIELAAIELVEGSFELVRSQRGHHVDAIEKARADGAIGPVFDPRPARGEWFEVLRDIDAPYRGVSANPLVVQGCVRLGADVVVGDPTQRLAATDPRTLGAVTAFRHVERLTPGGIAEFVDVAALAIQPGGLLIIETPDDPTDLHLDPFARRPVHPSLLRLLAERAGFGDVEIRHSDARVYVLTARR